jgi:hypothetical protein
MPAISAGDLACSIFGGRHFKRLALGQERDADPLV